MFLHPPSWKDGDELAMPDDLSSFNHTIVSFLALTEPETWALRADVGEVCFDLEEAFVVVVVRGGELTDEDDGKGSTFPALPVMTRLANLTPFSTGMANVLWTTPAPAPATAERSVGCWTEWGLRSYHFRLRPSSSRSTLRGGGKKGEQ